MAGNITEDSWVSIYIQGLDANILIILADLILKESRKVRWCCQNSACAPKAQ
jgi:hypothetical protein